MTIRPTPADTLNTFFKNYGLSGAAFAEAQSRLLAPNVETDVNLFGQTSIYHGADGYLKSLGDWSHFFGTDSDFQPHVPAVAAADGTYPVRLTGTLHLTRDGHTVTVAPEHHRWTETFTLDGNGKIGKLALAMNLDPTDAGVRFEAAMAEASRRAQQQQQADGVNPHVHVQWSPDIAAPGVPGGDAPAAPLPMPHDLTSKTAYHRVNLPWFNFGMDFGSNPWGYQSISTNPLVPSTLAQLHASGVDDIITWTIPDGRNLQFAADGTPSALTPGFTQDLSSWLDQVSAQGLTSELVLIDGNTWFPPGFTVGGVTCQGHGDVIADPTGKKQAAFDANFLSPMLDTIKAWQAAHPTTPLPVSGISVGNELYYGVNRDPQTPGKNVTMAQIQAFVRGRTALIHQQLPGVPVTVGAAKAEDLFDDWTDNQLGGTAAEHLDYYTFHDYDPQPLGDMSRAYPWGQLNKPVHMGEYPGTHLSTGPNPPLDFQGAITGPRGPLNRPPAPGRFVSTAALWAARHIDTISSPDPAAELTTIQNWFDQDFAS